MFAATSVSALDDCGAEAPKAEMPSGHKAAISFASELSEPDRTSLPFRYRVQPPASSTSCATNWSPVKTLIVTPWNQKGSRKCKGPDKSSPPVCWQVAAAFSGMVSSIAMAGNQNLTSSSSTQPVYDWRRNGSM